MKTKYTIINIVSLLLVSLLFLSGCGKKPEELAQIARQSDKKEERLKAVDKLKDENLLQGVAIASQDSDVAVAAVQKIKDEQALASLIKRLRSMEARLAAAERLTDADYLIAVAKFSLDAAVRRVVVGKIDDQEILADIAKSDKDEDVRGVAVERLTDQRLLVNVANNTRNWETGVKAIGKIQDQQALLGFVKTARNKEIRAAVIGQIKDQKVLADIAKNDDSQDVSVAAVKRLSDQPTLADVAQFGRNEWARLWAVSRISDQGVLEKFAWNHKDVKMRGIALREIADEDVIADIARKEPALIPVALYKMKDRQRMVALVKHWLANPSALDWRGWKWLSEVEDLEAFSMEKLSDQAMFADLAKTGSGEVRDEDSDRRRRGGIAGAFRQECLARVKEQKLLADIVKNADSRVICEKAFERLTDEALLADVAKHARDSRDADRALGKLREMPLVSQETLASVSKGRADRANAESAPLKELAAKAAPDLGLGMICVSKGWFASEGRDTVYIERPFLLGKYEVTQTQWEAVMGDDPSHFKGENRPVEQVSWNDVMAFCRKLTERERAAGRLPDGYEYTLPTEAQWEYACRAGSTGYYGKLADGTEGKLDDMGWYGGNSGRQTHDVGQKQPNAWGFYDMHGNVWEWCLDNYSGNLNRALRGGCWDNFGGYCRSAGRDWVIADFRFNYLGFRLALSSVRQ